ncbi:MAG: mechanosensitive ion channel family protein [Planctomycetota bacterium]|jgi:small-conductance mechanosensitive channel
MAEQEGAIKTQEEAAAPVESTLVWWNRPVAVFRSQTTQLDPEARTADALGRIEAAADQLLETEVTTDPAEIEGDEGYRFLVGETYLFTLLKSDLDELAEEDLEAGRERVLGNLEEIRRARIEQGSASAIARGITSALIATAVFVGVIVLLRLLTRAVAGFVERRIRAWRRLKLARADLRPHLATLSEQLVKVAALFLGFYLFCVWVAFVFHQFPLTEPLGLAFTARLKEFGGNLLRAGAGAIPGLVTAGVILILARWAARMVDRVIRSMGRDGDAGVLVADAAKATRRIAVAVIWIFGIVLAYPYLPGSGSDAFKGISVLLGLMVSLGSTGMINQVMSGFVLLYSGSVRTGEYVRVGKIEGTVTEMGILAVKLLTPQKEFLTIPNAVMISNPSTNYTRLSKDTGVPITANVTIGYDAAWRQVHQLLVDAAKATGGVVADPGPRVMQNALSDWYAEYTLTCYTDRAEGKNAVLSELNGQIQDAFNGASIQIMSPHYYDDKAEPLVIPRDRWFPKMGPGDPTAKDATS